MVIKINTSPAEKVIVSLQANFARRYNVFNDFTFIIENVSQIKGY